jgi:mannose-6-phosphate isomerase-like protein (cupin superfamily)
MLEEIKNGDQTLALIIRRSFNKPGISFVTPAEFTQQVAYMNHPAGKLIQPHVHNAVPREIVYTNEVLFIKRGKLRVDFYTQAKEYLHSRILEAGDVLLLAAGGHGFEVLEEIEMIEIKQGPYAGDSDKIRFNTADNFKPKFLP